VCSLMYMPNDGYCVKVGSHQPLGYDYFLHVFIQTMYDIYFNKINMKGKNISGACDN
jgi:hypothetical protein